MKHLRVTADVDQERAPPFYTMLSDSAAIAEARLLEWNLPGEGIETVLFAVDGDTDPFVAAAPDAPSIEAVERTETGRWTYLLLELRPLESPLFEAIRTARARRGLVVRKPVVYRDGGMQFRVVGTATALQGALADAPDAMDVQVERVGRFRGGAEDPLASLSERQREALEAALELGYYDRPRTATHDDIAAELDCAPPTASEHLQKAEAALVRAALDGIRRGHAP
ncbi:helix-turn-helix domain-containing protein [Haloglomus litoreum]|uniref:helix-turn-helix domain-containing protein n=1 Tax=Haloglomus litoreum TaxID=3034026 RepID=UPI0023E7C6AF|nr:helix-turn-helix domain-containing protein [Haloglomus sp. DT116]